MAKFKFVDVVLDGPGYRDTDVAYIDPSCVSAVGPVEVSKKNGIAFRRVIIGGYEFLVVNTRHNMLVVFEGIFPAGIEHDLR